MRDNMLKKIKTIIYDELEKHEPDEEDVFIQKEAFLNAVLSKKSRKKRTFYLLSAAALIMAGFVTVFTLNNFSNTQTNNPPVFSNAIAHKVVENRDHMGTITFESGSTFIPGINSKIELVKSSNKEIVVNLERGLVDCSINGNGYTKWIVQADRYKVIVTGTKFTVTYEPENDFFKVNVKRGSVLILGPNLNAMGIPVSKGETLTANGETIKIKNINAKDQNDNFSSEENRKPLKKHKKRKQIKHKSTNENSDNIESNNEYELLFNMANESRYKHDSQKSIELFKELRTKFPGRSYSKQALFLMGRIEQEQNKNNAQAKKWFEQYLRESQNGRLKEQAIGRLIELCKNMNNSCKIEYAKQYLNNYKNGTFANLAESVLH